MQDKKSVSILGSTGSVGCSTVDLIAREPEKYSVVALTANKDVNLLAEQARALKAKRAVVADSSCYQALKDALAGSGIEAAAGATAVSDAAAMPSDWVMAAIVGAAGLEPTLQAVRRGAEVALANKECLVCSGDLFMREVAAHGARLLPVDSEHNAIFQVFDFENPSSIERIILTSSGGPFRNTDMAKMAQMTPKQALAHPNFAMGAKISIDSATMMNKGLEIIEAKHLFPVTEEQIEVLVHPQQTIHSMVSYVDGTILAQLGTPDMRIPIAYALAWPKRIRTPVARLDFVKVGQMTFEPPDPQRFPALRLARQALQTGGSAPTILNAANEVAVYAFLDGRIGFLEIARVVEETLERLSVEPLDDLEAVRDVDMRARVAAGTLVAAAAE